MSRAFLMDFLQWFGFVNVVVGVWRYQKHFVQGCLFSLIGCNCLAAWCLFTTPIPWGMLAVQVVCIGVWLRNYYHAAVDLKMADEDHGANFSARLMQLCDDYIDTPTDADLVIEELYERADAVCQWRAKRDE